MWVLEYERRFLLFVSRRRVKHLSTVIFIRTYRPPVSRLSRRPDRRAFWASPDHFYPLYPPNESCFFSIAASRKDSEAWPLQINAIQLSFKRNQIMTAAPAGSKTGFRLLPWSRIECHIRDRLHFGRRGLSYPSRFGMNQNADW